MRKASFQDLITQINHFRHEERPGFAFFLGAGASRSSGVLLADELASKAFEEMFIGHGNEIDMHAPLHLTAERVRLWAEAQPWYDTSSKGRYQLAMERAFLSQPARETFLRRHTRSARPSRGYWRLAQLLKARIVDTIYTTNFDDLMRRGCSILEEPLVEVASLDQYRQQNPSPCEPRLIRLHGDFWHGNVLNTEGELEKTPRIRLGTVHRLSSPQGMIVIGYGGRDRKVMIDLFQRYIGDKQFLKNGLFWCIRRGSEVPPHVHVLMDKDSVSKVHLVEIDGFDEALEHLATAFDRGTDKWGLTDSLRSLVEVQALLTDTAELLVDSNSEGELVHEIASVFTRLVRQLGAKEGALLTADGDAAEIVASVNMLPQGARVLGGAPILNLPPGHSRELNAQDLAGTELFPCVAEDRFVMAFPARQNGECLGVIIFGFDSTLPGNEYDDRIISTLCGLLVLASKRLRQGDADGKHSNAIRSTSSNVS